jgi:uncharacterized repeat protein (TIGR01451 family)
MKKFISLLTVLFVLLLSVAAFAKPIISVNMKAEKETTVNKVTKKVAADKVNPGEVIFYTINYVNSGNEEATNAVLEDPIPKGTVYIPGSAFGVNTEITFSIDGGKTFKKPSLLTYEFKSPGGKMEKRTASAEQYTHIRWIVNTIPAGGKGQVGFQVRMK